MWRVILKGAEGLGGVLLGIAGLGGVATLAIPGAVLFAGGLVGYEVVEYRQRKRQQKLLEVHQGEARNQLEKHQRELCFALMGAIAKGLLADDPDFRLTLFIPDCDDSSNFRGLLRYQKGVQGNHTIKRFFPCTEGLLGRALANPDRFLSETIPLFLDGTEEVRRKEFERHHIEKLGLSESTAKSLSPFMQTVVEIGAIAVTNESGKVVALLTIDCRALVDFKAGEDVSAPIQTHLVRRIEGAEHSGRLGAKQRAILQLLEGQAWKFRSDVLLRTSASQSSLQGLVQKKLVEMEERAVDPNDLPIGVMITDIAHQFAVILGTQDRLNSLDPDQKVPAAKATKD